MAIILNGKKLAEKIKNKLSQEIKEKNIKPGLAVILVGNDPSSIIYTNNKKDACSKVGIDSISYNLPAKTTESELLVLIDKLNKDQKIHGILVQLPLPRRISIKKVLNAISPNKDVDGFHPINVGRLYLGELCLQPCTPAGIMLLLKEYKINPSGQHAVIVGASNIVGKPCAELLLQAGATVTVCHDKTKELKKYTKQADIIISAVGIRDLITANMLKKGVVAIDVGIKREENKIYGDVDFSKVSKIASAITPVPGGVGPMTIAMLMSNCLKAYWLQKDKNK